MQALTQVSYITPQALRKGDTDQNVEFLQQLLNNVLYPDTKDKNKRLVVDGIFGSKTEDAVRIFQGPDNDGIVGAKTWRVLGIYTNTPS